MRYQEEVDKALKCRQNLIDCDDRENEVAKQEIDMIEKCRVEHGVNF